MTSKKRSYEDYCAAAHALDLVGERWALLVVRELLLGPRRFTDLRTGMPAISPNVLTQRLNDMEAAGIVKRHRLPRPANAWVYELTEWGKELEPIVLQLAQWGVRSPAFERGKAVSADAMVLSLKAMFLSSAALDAALRIRLTIQAESYLACVSDGTLDIMRWPQGGVSGGAGPLAAQAEVQADTPALLALAYGGLDPEAGQAAGMLRYQGDLAALRRFFSLFRLPPQAMSPDMPALHSSPGGA
jgi:DNA-binding HxlR family transcriptional regulator